MKKLCKLISMIMAIVFVFELTAPAAFAADISSHQVSILWEDVDEATGVAQQVAEFENLLFFSYTDEDISYSSQITPANEIQFSYVLAGVDKIYVTGLNDIDEIRGTYGITQADPNYELLNQTIIENIIDFEVDSELIIAQPPMTRGFSNLQDAIEDAFGANYSSRVKGTAWKNHNGTNYTVRCTESQTTSYTGPDSMWFAKDTAVTAIIAWLLTGGWGWISLGVSLVTGVVSTVLVNGVRQTVNNFRAERSDVSLMHTRIVTIVGYTGTQYWAGWTRKMYFFKGELGWTHDTGYHYNSKHSDFDDVSYLMQHGFDNFVNYTLTGY